MPATCDPAARRARCLTRRDRRALGALGLLALAVLALWRPVSTRVTTALVLRSAAPSETVLAELIEQSANPAGILNRLWSAGSSSGRLFVVGHLLRHSDDATLCRRMEAVVVEAVNDADLEVRDMAFKVLSQQSQPSLRGWLRQQLNDADPAVRVLALQHLARLASANDAPAAIRLLDDPDPRVIVAAGNLLKRITRQDFGLKTTHALPIFAWKADAPPPAADWEAIRRGREGWRAWWRLHRDEFPAAESAPAPPLRIRARPVPDFTLKDPGGRTVRLSGFRGKVALLTFWNPTNHLSFVDEPVLAELQQRRAAQLEILAVVVAPAAWPHDSCGDHAGGHGGGQRNGHAHGHAHHAKLAASPATTLAEARALADQLGARHSVLLDAKGALPVRFGLEDLPAYVLIDAQGHLRRRFTGSRAAAVFEAMVNDAAAPANPRATAP